MRTFSVIELGLAVTIIALAGISVVTAASLLAQSASATDVTMNNTTVGGRGEAVSEHDYQQFKCSLGGPVHDCGF